MVKKQKLSDLVKKIFLVAAKQVSRSAMPNKLFLFMQEYLLENSQNKLNSLGFSSY